MLVVELGEVRALCPSRERQSGLLRLGGCRCQRRGLHLHPDVDLPFRLQQQRREARIRPRSDLARNGEGRHIRRGHLLRVGGCRDGKRETERTEHRVDATSPLVDVRHDSLSSRWRD